MPEAAAILEKTLVAYDSASTARLTTIWELSHGETLERITVAGLAENDGHGSIARSCVELHTSRSGPQQPPQEIACRILNTGTEIFRIHLAARCFTRVPRTPDRLSGLLSTAVGNAQRIAGELDVSECWIDDRWYYRLSCQRPHLIADILVERDTLYLQSLRVETLTETGWRIAELRFLEQTLGEPLPPDAFVWEPPAGFQEVRPITPPPIVPRRRRSKPA